MNSIFDKNNLDLDNKDNPVSVFYFCSPDCGPCKAIEPMMIKIEKAFPNVDFYKADIFENKNRTVGHNIQGVPVVVIMNRNNLHKILTVGQINRRDVIECIREANNA